MDCFFSLARRRKPMNANRLVLLTVFAPAMVWAAAQSPDAVPPPAPQAPPAIVGTSATHSGRITAVVYGPQGEVQAILLGDGAAVSLPPDLAMRAQAGVVRGSRVQVSGTQRVIAGQVSLIAQSLTANGQTFVAALPAPGPAFAGGAPPPPPPPAPRGRPGPDAPPPPAP